MTRDVLTRDQVASRLLAGGDGKTYLEIGVSKGVTIRAIEAERTIGVDPCLSYDLRHPRRQRWTLSGHLNRLRRATRGRLLFADPSDDFFARHADLFDGRGIDVALVDGLHHADQAYRDVMNCVAHLAPGGAVVMHDCRPLTASSAIRDEDEARAQPDFNGAWNGDVWKAVLRLRAELRDHTVLVLDTDEGLGIVYRGAPEQVLDFDLATIEAMTFEDLQADRTRLLDLRPAEAFEAEILAAIRASA